MALTRILTWGLGGAITGSGLTSTGLWLNSGFTEKMGSEIWCDFLDKHLNLYPTCYRYQKCGYGCSDNAMWIKLGEDLKTAESNYPGEHTSLLHDKLAFWAPIGAGLGFLAGVAYGSYRELKKTYKNLEEKMLTPEEKEILKEAKIAETEESLEEAIAEIRKKNPDVNITIYVSEKPAPVSRAENRISQSRVSNTSQTLFYPDLSRSPDNINDVDNQSSNASYHAL